MSKERGQRNRDLFQAWIAEMNAKESPNWLDYWHGDTLSPKKIASELGFDPSAFKKARNETLFNMLQDLKQQIATLGIYHQRKTNLPLDNEVIDVSKETEEDIKDSAKVRDLKRVNRRLQNENAKLAAEVVKLSEFKEVLIEMGLWK
jgi:cell division septum initiation protein DivIVA